MRDLYLLLTRCPPTMERPRAPYRNKGKRVCTGCHEEKPEGEFYERKRYGKMEAFTKCKRCCIAQVLARKRAA